MSARQPSQVTAKHEINWISRKLGVLKVMLVSIDHTRFSCHYKHSRFYRATLFFRHFLHLTRIKRIQSLHGV